MTSAGKTASVEVQVFDAVKIKDQIVETIRKMPNEKEIATLLNEAGASYIFDLTVPSKQAEKMMTKSDQSFGLGLYSFDLLYASVYQAWGCGKCEISQISEKLIDNLGTEATRLFHQKTIWRGSRQMQPTRIPSITLFPRI